MNSDDSGDRANCRDALKQSGVEHCPDCDRSLLDEWDECPECNWKDPDPPIEMRVGENYIRLTSDSTRAHGMAFLVAVLDIKPEEVAAIREEIGMNRDETHEEPEDETDE